MTATRPSRSNRGVVAGLLALGLIPVVAGAFRVTTLAVGTEVTPENARFVADPVPVVVHIVGASLYCVLGAFQFATRFRRHHPAWHRRVGRVLVPCGLAAALAGVWMTLAYPLPDRDDALFNAFRLAFGSAMAAAIVLGLLAIRRRDVAAHRAWMARGYAIGMGAGTQALLHLPWAFAGAENPTGTTRALLMGAGWVINLAVAERALRNRPRPVRSKEEVR